MKSFKKLILGLALAVLVPVSSQAAFIPVGVQNNVDISTVTGAWGWTQLYRGDYNVNSVSIASLFAGAQDYVMLGAIQDGSNEIYVLAAALLTDVQTYTARHATHTANGAEWYYNGGSMGFAGLGDTISQNQADTSFTTETDRLSWHTDGGTSIGEYTLAPVNMRFGWRAGDVTGLNGDPGWDKIIFTANAGPATVPEPASLALFGLGSLGMGVIARRRKRKLELAS